MGYKALITIDLPNEDSETRKTFYEVLEEKKWEKIKTLTTAWKASFKDGVTRKNALVELENDLKAAKTKSKAKTVEYAIQLDKEDVVINTLSK